MAAAVARAIEARRVLVTEAGTGTGKTYAYLVPVLQSGAKAIVSTGTKTLQDQLFHRDIPVVRQALSSPARVAMLKGRANYLCLHRLEQAERSPEITTAHYADRLRRVRAWAGRTRSGEISEVADIPEGDLFWSQVTSNIDNCLGQECPAYADCHVLKARRAAQEADIVVVNHHLLFSDLMLRREGVGEVLPDTDLFVLDEAHQLPGIASSFFGAALSGRQLTELARDSQRAAAECADMPLLEAGAQRIDQDMAAFRRALGAAGRQAPWSGMAARPEVGAALGQLRESLSALTAQLAQVAPRSKALESCARRGEELGGRLALFSGDADSEDQVAWFETSRRSFVLHLTPMDLAPGFQDCMRAYRAAWVFTSATLAVGERFNHFTARLGLEEADTGRWDSPFDYERNALLYLPSDMPEPGSLEYTARAVDAICPVLEASGGRAFVLFTSYRALQEATAMLTERLAEFPLLVQGSLPRSELLERFRMAGNAVLLGTGSFWEGVDVRGSALSCVVIDKLPFAAPDDPVFQARADMIKRRGGNPFRDYQLPNAVIALKQGVGRLIRAVDDRGVVVICDPRILSRSYGKAFLNDLPTTARTRLLAEVEDFFAAENCIAVDTRAEPGVIHRNHEPAGH